MKCGNMAIVFSTFTILLLATVDMVTPVYPAEDDIKLEQSIKLNEKCKNGMFGDPKGSVASTITGTCSQHAENNVYRAPG
jgi:hypothetical protein